MQGQSLHFSEEKGEYNKDCDNVMPGHGLLRHVFPSSLCLTARVTGPAAVNLEWQESGKAKFCDWFSFASSSRLQDLHADIKSS